MRKNIQFFFKNLMNGLSMVLSKGLHNKKCMGVMVLAVVVCANAMLSGLEVTSFLNPASFSSANVSGLTASAASVSDYQSKKNSIKNKLGDIDRKKQSAQARINNSKSKAAYYRRLAVKSSKEYKQLKEQLDYVRKVKQQIKNEVEKAKKEYANKVAEMEQRVTTMYTTSSMSYFYILLSAKSVTDFINRSKIITNILDNDKNIIQEVEDRKKDLDYKLDVQKRRFDAANKVAQKKKREMDRLMKNESKFNSEVADTQAYLEQLEAQEDEIQKESERLDSLISSLTAGSSGGSGSGGGSTHSNGKFLWPVPSCHSISSYYGNRMHPIFHYMRFHSGVDIGGASGARIIAVESGTVIISGWQNGYGNVVSINHGGGITTLYAHASKRLVSVGQKVTAGQTIALVGSTGWSTGPHCHFEVRVNGSTVNPLDGYI